MAPLIAAGSLQNLEGISVQIAEAIGLDLIGQDSEQQVPGQMLGCKSSELVLPANPQGSQIEIAQVRDLLLNCLALKPAALRRLKHGVPDFGELARRPPFRIFRVVRTASSSTPSRVSPRVIFRLQLTISIRFSAVPSFTMSNLDCLRA
jgi:hypothetical protein